MAHFETQEATSGPAVAVHAGLNSVVVQYTLDETASGSTSIAICALPAGAEVTRAMVRANHAALNAGAAPGAVRLYPTIGGNSVGDLISTATISYQIQSGAAGNNESGLGVRLTGSANLILNLEDLTGTGTASTVFTVIVDYLAEKSGD